MDQPEVTGNIQGQQSDGEQPFVEGGLFLEQSAPHSQGKRYSLLYLLGPGFLSGMAGNDATGMTTYAIDGAKAGYGHLWLQHSPCHRCAISSTLPYQGPLVGHWSGPHHW